MRCPPRRAGLLVQAAKTAGGPSVAIVGVTGAVGQEFLRVRILPGGFVTLGTCRHRTDSALSYVCEQGCLDTMETEMNGPIYETVVCKSNSAAP